MSDFLSLAQQFITQVQENGAQNNLVNAPWRNSAIHAIQSGDQTMGQELAMNIIQSCGFSSPEEAVRVGIQNLASRK